MTTQSATSSTITPARLDWLTDEQGHIVPVSRDFGDVYYSMVDGLSESRYVFVEQNHLPERFSQLFEAVLSPISKTDPPRNSTFTIAELGFGTGLNLLVTWQLWQEVKSRYYADTQQYDAAQPPTAPAGLPPRLHIISTEKFPLSRQDLARSLASWQQAAPALTPFIEKLLSCYPTLIAGCHRLNLDSDVTLDLRLGDAAENLAKLDKSHGAAIDAWFLDGFAPSCNESLWAEQIFNQIQRLSKVSTTAATFSCAGVVKRGLKNAGFSLKKVKGFGRKREMLTGTLLTDNKTKPAKGSAENPLPPLSQVTVIGAGVSGLMSAWALAQRGIKVQLLDKSAPLAGASGNPRGLLAPKMTPIHHVDEHLHSIGYLYSRRLFHSLDNATTHTTDQKPPLIFEPVAALDLLTKANVTVAQIADYPDEMATTLTETDAKALSAIRQQDLTDNLYLPQAGLVNPQALADKVLAHPMITFNRRHISRIESDDNQVTLHCQTENGDKETIHSEAVVIAAAYESCQLDDRIFDFRKIRGQLSWFTPTADQLGHLPKLPLKYGGYCALFVPKSGDERLNSVTPNTPQFLLGASFVRNDLNQESRQSEHQINRDKLIEAVAELTEVIAENTENWQSRVGIRAQTPDYHPLVGPLGRDDQDTDNLSPHNRHELSRVWTMSGMGSKGYAFAPICAEALADILTGAFAPLSATMIQRLSPDRSRLQTSLTPNK